MGVRYVDWITRDMVRAAPEEIFIFGDNAMRVGMGGQAASMRGEPNALGVATKFAPGNSHIDYFSIESLPRDLLIVTRDLDKVAQELKLGRSIVVPKDGLGTGLSQLPDRVPDLANLITAFFRACPGERCPWEFV